MDVLRIRPESYVESASSMKVHSDSTAASLRMEVGGRRIPLSIPVSQRYFWTRTWQQGEAESVRDIANGDVRTFADPLDAIRWLLA